MPEAWKEGLRRGDKEGEKGMQRAVGKPAGDEPAFVLAPGRAGRLRGALMPCQTLADGEGGPPDSIFHRNRASLD
jgi:hypothetical protein